MGLGSPVANNGGRKALEVIKIWFFVKLGEKNGD